jgi:hypothetical protein
MATMFCYFIACVTLSVFETVSSPLTMDEYGWNAQQVRGERRYCWSLGHAN